MTVAVAALSVGVTDLSTVVLSFLDAFGAKDIVQLGASVRPRLNPRLDGFEHRSVGIVAHVAQGRMVEHLQAVLDDLMLGDVGILPGVKDARRHVPEDGGSDLAGRLVQNVGEVIFGQQRVGGIRASRIGPRLVLVLTRSVNDAGRSRLQRLGGSVDERADERGQQRHDKDRQRLGDLLNQRLQPGDLLDDRRKFADHIVSELKDRVDLLDGLAWVKFSQGTGGTLRLAGFIGPR